MSVLTEPPVIDVPRVRWHRPLMIMSAVALALALVCLAGLALDRRMLGGAPIWLKPAKFAVSSAIYGVTLAWQLSLLRRRRRLGWVLGTVVAVVIVVELSGIVLQVVRGEPSHFNFTSSLNMIIFLGMAAMIVVLWLANLAAGVLFLMQKLGDRSISWAVRAGTAIAVTGMATAFFMTNPSPEQLATVRAGGPRMIGAHTVGAPDGGPGLPLVGWSTVAGDLRVPHFVGIHGLQAVLLLALLLSALGARIAWLRSDRIRTRLVLIFSGGYAGLLALVTVQALRGQSVVRPDAITVGVAAALAAATIAGFLLVARPARGRVDQAGELITTGS